MKARLWLGLAVLVAGGGSGCASASRVAAPSAAAATPTPASGPVAWSPEWKPFEAYLSQLITGVQQAWQQTTIASRTYPESGTSVVVRFRLDREGSVAEIVSVEGTAAVSAQRNCVNAIASRASYGRWTNEMVAALGEKQELTFTFFYQ